VSASPLVLASASPRRATLLRDAGVSVEVRPVDCDETPRPREAPVPYARRIAEAKLTAALPNAGGRRVLAADTIVWLEAQGTPLGKPTDATACAKMLHALTAPGGHFVTTAWATGTSLKDIEVHDETTAVWFRPLQPEEVQTYLRTDAWRDKAGGYGIQAEAASWVTRIEGSYTNVVGLPVAQVVARLQELAR
jgi:septum formation protein